MDNHEEPKSEHPFDEFCGCSQCKALLREVKIEMEEQQAENGQIEQVALSKETELAEENEHDQNEPSNENTKSDKVSAQASSSHTINKGISHQIKREPNNDEHNAIPLEHGYDEHCDCTHCNNLRYQVKLELKEEENGGEIPNHIVDASIAGGSGDLYHHSTNTSTNPAPEVNEHQRDNQEESRGEHSFDEHCGCSQCKALLLEVKQEMEEEQAKNAQINQMAPSTDRQGMIEQQGSNDQTLTITDQPSEPLHDQNEPLNQNTKSGKVSAQASSSHTINKALSVYHQIKREPNYDEHNAIPLEHGYDEYCDCTHCNNLRYEVKLELKQEENGGDQRDNQEESRGEHSFDEHCDCSQCKALLLEVKLEMEEEQAKNTQINQGSPSTDKQRMIEQQGSNDQILTAIDHSSGSQVKGIHESDLGLSNEGEDFQTMASSPTISMPVVFEHQMDTTERLEEEIIFRPTKRLRVEETSENENITRESSGDETALDRFYDQSDDDKEEEETPTDKTTGEEPEVSSIVEDNQTNENNLKKIQDVEVRNVNLQGSSRNKKRSKKSSKVRDKKFKCSFMDCKKSFDRNSKLTEHMRTHTGVRPFKCSWKGCDKTFSRQSNVTSHLRTHTGEKPHPCTWEGCDKTFGQLSHLNDHLRTHTRVKPYTCPWKDCGQAFSTSSNMTDHLRTHTGERPYNCDWPDCDASFVSSSHLKKHYRTHTGEKPYQCDRCEAKFARSDHLVRHKKNVHKQM